MLYSREFILSSLQVNLTIFFLFSFVNARTAEASASLTLVRQSTEATNKQCRQEDAATYGPLGPP